MIIFAAVYGADYTARLTKERDEMTWNLINLHDRDIASTQNHKNVIIEYSAIPHIVEWQGKNTFKEILKLVEKI